MGRGGAAAVLLFLVWPYAHGHFGRRDPLLVSLVRFVLVEPEWIFCLSVPFVVGWMVREQRAVLRAIKLEPSRWAIPLLMLAGFLYWAGYKVDTRYPGYAAAQLFAAGCVLGIGGRRWFRHLLLPWCFLFFLWPLPPLEKVLSVPLRHLTSVVTAKFLTWTGLPTDRIGATLLSSADAGRGLEQGGLFSLGVDAPCSGINSLFTLIMLAALMAFITFKDWKKRSILIAAAIPLAVLGNIVRMVMLAWGARFWGMNFAVGTTVQGQQQDSSFHFLAGMMVFAVALGGLFLLSSRLEGQKEAGRKVREPRLAQVTPVPISALWSSLAVVVFAMAVVFACYVTPTGRALSDFGLKSDLPMELPGYQVRGEAMTPKERDVFEDGVELSRAHYFSTTSDEVYLATVVRSGPVTRSLHEPEVCLPGQGWTIASSQRVKIQPMDGSAPFEATMLELFMDSRPAGSERLVRQRAVNVYWYQGYDVATPSYENHVLLTYRDALFRNLNHRWAMASFFLSMPLTYLDQQEVFAEQLACERLKEFVERCTPLILERHSGE